MTSTFTICVSGSRDWKDVKCIDTVLDAASKRVPIDCKVTLVHGACRGLDVLAATRAPLVLGERLGRVVGVPAAWAEHGKSAGPIRNRQMIAQYAPDLLIAFHEDLTASKVTAHFVQEARQYLKCSSGTCGQCSRKHYHYMSYYRLLKECPERIESHVLEARKLQWAHGFDPINRDKVDVVQIAFLHDYGFAKSQKADAFKVAREMLKYQMPVSEDASELIKRDEQLDRLIKAFPFKKSGKPRGGKPAPAAEKKEHKQRGPFLRQRPAHSL